MKAAWFRIPFIAAFLAAGLLGAASDANAQEVTAKMQPKIDAYKKKAQEWAAHAEIVKAVKESNARGPIPGMANAKWRELKEDDPLVTALTANPAGKLLTQWMNEDAKGINKIVLTGAQSHRVAFTSMPAAYLGKGRPNFDTSFNDGKVWQQGDIKPDPSTQIPTVQISAPVKDGQEVIGVLLVSLTAAPLLHPLDGERL